MTNTKLDTDTLEMALSQLEQIEAKIKAAQYDIRQKLEDVRRGAKLGQYELGQTLLIAQLNLTAKLLGDEDE